MEIFQYIMIVFSLFALSRILIQYKNRTFNNVQTIFWSCIWIAIIGVSIVPGFFSFISDILGVGRLVDVLVYISIGIIFYLLYKIFVKFEEQRKQITTLSRHIAINEKKDNRKKLDEKKSTR